MQRVHVAPSAHHTQQPQQQQSGAQRKLSLSLSLHTLLLSPLFLSLSVCQPRQQCGA